MPLRAREKEAQEINLPGTNAEEEIPRDVVEMFDIMDRGDPTVPPRFVCEKCGGELGQPGPVP